MITPNMDSFSEGKLKILKRCIGLIINVFRAGNRYDYAFDRLKVYKDSMTLLKDKTMYRYIVIKQKRTSKVRKFSV